MNQKPMKESVIRTELLLGKEPCLQEKYANITGNVRFGLLLEYLDLLAAKTAYKHAGDEKELRIVTASVDRIDINKPIKVTSDVYFNSSVSYVGKSSAVVDIDVFSTDTDAGIQYSEKAASCSFTMVALDKNFKPMEIAKVVPESEEEKVRFENAKNRKGIYENQRKTFENFVPSEKEIELAYKLFNDFLSGNLEGMLMKESRMQKVGPMYPQSQNIHGKIFGGYIMKEAFELAWTTAYTFLGYKNTPLIVSVDKIDFLRPVEIGDIVEFESFVCFTGNTSINVEVSVKKLYSRISSDKKLTNDCHFTFVAVDEKGNPRNVPKVVPVSLDELATFALGYRMYGKSVK